MNGNQLWIFLINSLAMGRILYTSKIGHHTFYRFLGNNKLQFNIPNYQSPNNPHKKVIPSDILIRAREFYIENGYQIEINSWLLENRINWYGDCRVRVLKELIKLPEHLEN